MNLLILNKNIKQYHSIKSNYMYSNCNYKVTFTNKVIVTLFLLLRESYYNRIATKIIQLEFFNALIRQDSSSLGCTSGGIIFLN